MLLTRSLLAVTAISATALAQAVTLPTSAIGAVGGSGNVFPWGTTSYPGMRIMNIYDSSHFTGAPTPVTTPIMITTLRWRADNTVGSWAGGTYPNCQVRLATAAVDYTAASTNWATNLGPDVTTVYSGNVTVSPITVSSTTTPAPFQVTINLSTPFIYDPMAGDLVIDTEHAPSAFTGGTIPAHDVMTVGVNGSRVYSSTLYPAANGVDSACDVMEIGYSAVVGTPATNLILGQGCVRQYTSFYEFFPTPAAFDLAGSGMMMIPNGSGGYVVTQGGTFLPVGSVQVTPTALALGDDSGVTQPLTVGSFAGPSGPWTSINVISNGIVSQAAGNTLIAAPNPGTLLSGPQTGFYSQADFDPIGGTGSGTIWFEESASVISITWDNVKTWNVAGTNTFQFQLYPSGLVNIVWVTMTPLGSNGGVMVGYSPGGASLDPGNTDLSNIGVTPINTSTTDVPPLALNPGTRPVLGTNWNLTTSQIPPTGIFGVDIFGITDPGILDLFFLGMPGCQLRTTLDVIAGPWVVGGTTHNYSFAVPATPTSLIGFQLFTQSAVWQVPPVNAFGAIISNGVRGRLGDV